MADLNYIDRDLEVKIVGQDATGLGVNYVTADANGNMAVKDYSDGPVTPGTVASASALIGGQFNTTLPTLTNTQQSAVQLNQFGDLSITQRNKYRNIAGIGTTFIKSGSGTLQAITINNPNSGGIIVIYDSTTGSGTVIMTLTFPKGGINSSPTCFSNLGAEFTQGVTAVSTGSYTNNITVFYQ